MNKTSIAIIVEGGSVVDVLASGNTPIYVEVIDMDTQNPGEYEEKLHYKEELYGDSTYHSVY